MDHREFDCQPASSRGAGPANHSGLFILPKTPRAAQAKVVTYTASGQTVIESKFSEQLELLTDAYIAEYQPRGISELVLVRDLASSRCRCEYTKELQQQPEIASSAKMMATLTRFFKSSNTIFNRSLRILKKIQRVRERESAKRPYMVKVKG